jgi:hypothetical protein
MFKYKYIPEDKENNLISYKYSGTDQSILYNKVFSILANWQVDYTFPPWLA